MEKVENVRLSSILNTKSSLDVFENVKVLFSDNYDARSFEPIEKTFYLTMDLFEGRYPGYKECNTQYHNFNHTLDVFLASMRLLDGYNYINKRLLKDIAVDLLIASLLHDAGYIQEKWDNSGTGAKYTDKHVKRSIAFVEKEYNNFNIKEEDARIITRLISTTDIDVEKNRPVYSSEDEKIAAFMLGTADIIGQMSDREYLERLLFLYYEFKEAGIPGYNTEFDIIKNTLSFYEKIKKRLIKQFDDVYMYSVYHFKKRINIQKNLYITEINNNIEYLKKIIDDASSNFRKKLKRGVFSYIHL